MVDTTSSPFIPQQIKPDAKKKSSNPTDLGDQYDVDQMPWLFPEDIQTAQILHSMSQGQGSQTPPQQQEGQGDQLSKFLSGLSKSGKEQGQQELMTFLGPAIKDLLNKENPNVMSDKTVDSVNRYNLAVDAIQSKMTETMNTPEYQEAEKSKGIWSLATGALFAVGGWPLALITNVQANKARGKQEEMMAPFREEQQKVLAEMVGGGDLEKRSQDYKLAAIQLGKSTVDSWYQRNVNYEPTEQDRINVISSMIANSKGSLTWDEAEREYNMMVGPKATGMDPEASDRIEKQKVESRKNVYDIMLTDEDSAKALHKAVTTGNNLDLAEAFRGDTKTGTTGKVGKAASPSSLTAEEFLEYRKTVVSPIVKVFDKGIKETAINRTPTSDWITDDLMGMADVKGYDKYFEGATMTKAEKAKVPLFGNLPEKAPLTEMINLGVKEMVKAAERVKEGGLWYVYMDTSTTPRSIGEKVVRWLEGAENLEKAKGVKKRKIKVFKDGWTEEPDDMEIMGAFDEMARKPTKGTDEFRGFIKNDVIDVLRR